MADETARHSLRQALTRNLGAEEAATLMEHLPPVRWDQLATKDDLELQTERMESKFDTLRFELLAEIRKVTLEQTRLLFFAMIGAIFTTASLAFAAARF